MAPLARVAPDSRPDLRAWHRAPRYREYVGIEGVVHFWHGQRRTRNVPGGDDSIAICCELRSAQCPDPAPSLEREQSRAVRPACYRRRRRRAQSVRFSSASLAPRRWAPIPRHATGASANPSVPLRSPASRLRKIADRSTRAALPGPPSPRRSPSARLPCLPSRRTRSQTKRDRPNPEGAAFAGFRNGAARCSARI